MKEVDTQREAAWALGASELQLALTGWRAPALLTSINGAGMCRSCGRLTESLAVEACPDCARDHELVTAMATHSAEAEAIACASDLIEAQPLKNRDRRGLIPRPVASPSKSKHTWTLPHSAS